MSDCWICDMGVPRKKGKGGQYWHGIEPCEKSLASKKREHDHLEQKVKRYQSLIARLRGSAKGMRPVNVLTGTTYCEWVVTMIDNAVGDDDEAKFGPGTGNSTQS